MAYAYDRAIALPVRDLYDTLIMAMSINAARDMYEKGLKQIEDFYNKYSDFISPIQKDMDWYALNVTGKASNFINQLYANGIDPLRSAEGRAAVAQLVRSMPIGDIAKVRQSAENAKQYNKAMAELQANGLYNPNTERYAGKRMSEFSTIDDGVWDRMSPVPYQNMAKFSKDYFDNISPILRSASKNGISYTIKEINEGDLHNIADRHFNDLVNTPQGQLMYKYYKDVTGSDEGARLAFNDAVVSGNLDRLKYEDDYNDNWLKRRELAIKAGELQLKREKFNLEKALASGAAGQNEQGLSLAARWYFKGASNAWSADGIRKNWNEMTPERFLQFATEAKKVFTDFGRKNKNLTTDKEVKAFMLKFSIKMDEEAVASIIGSPVDGNKKVSKATDAALARLFSVDDIVTYTAGFGKPHRGMDKTEQIRKAIQDAGSANVTITPLGDGYASLRKQGGMFSVMPRVRITIGDKKFDAYYNIDLESATTHGGAYMESKDQGVHNVLPDLDNWVGYGVWDTRETSKQLKAKASESLGTY